MAVQTFQGLSILLGGEDFACRAKSFEAPSVDFAKLETTALCSTWEESIAGKGSWTWNGELMQDHATNEVDQIVNGSTGFFGSTAPLTMLPAGTTDGSVTYMGNATSFAYTPVMATYGELAMARVGAAGTGPAVRGTLMASSAARTSTANGTGSQLGAITAAQRMYAALHITSVSGTTPTLAVKVQSATANTFSGATDRITFSTANSVQGQWSSVAGAVTDTWWRVVWTITGTSPSFTFAVSLGIGALA